MGTLERNDPEWFLKPIRVLSLKYYDFKKILKT